MPIQIMIFDVLKSEMHIYTVRQMQQLIADVTSGATRDRDFLLKNRHYIDLLPPNIEPNGYESLEEARYMRLDHRAAVAWHFP